MVLWQDDTSVLGASCVAILQLFSDKTAITLKEEELNAYLVHLVHFNFSPHWFGCLINNEYVMIGFLAVDNVESRKRFLGMMLCRFTGSLQVSILMRVTLIRLH